MPGLAFFISCFYKCKELLFRIGVFVSAASMAGAFGGLLATVLSRISPWGVSSVVIHTWRNIFFFEGIFTILVRVIVPFLIPERAQNCYFLNNRERNIATLRLSKDSHEKKDDKITWNHVKSAMKDVNHYFCALGLFFINTTVQGISLFLPTILKELGWSAAKAQLNSVPPYVCACPIAIAVATVSDKTNRRGVYLAIFAFPAIAGFSILLYRLILVSVIEASF
ncbi:major facilitator superfamily domain-containing protein [Bipolaris maydis]|nr:major facilitator superfamily domain-containing protein [Bipolaris maydis]